MKKLLALALTLVMTLGLVCPALAADEVTVELASGLPETLTAEPGAKSIANEAPEVQEFLREMYENGALTQDNSSYDLGYFDEDGQRTELTAEEIAALNEKYGLEVPEDDTVYAIGDLGVSLDLPDDWWWDSVFDPTPEVATLTLYVNGVATDVELTAEDGVTYADAGALRQFFGAQTVPADKAGLLPVRETAEKAGWDVQWYGGGWRSIHQEVQLWDQASYLASLKGLFPKELEEFVFDPAAKAETGIFAEKPTTTHQTATVELTQFSTLDGDETYKLTFDATTTTGGGVTDVVVTFDVAQLLKLFQEDALENLTQQGGFTITQLRQFLKAGVMEFILDYNGGSFAYNVPLLGLVNEDYTGWQTIELPGYAERRAENQKKMAEMNWTKLVYQMLLSYAQSNGAEEGLAQYDAAVAMLAVFLGKDRITTQGNKVTYSLTTDTMNELMTTLLLRNVYGMDEGEELPTLRIFKDFTLTMTSQGNTTKTDLHVRMDMQGISSAILSVSDYYDPYFSLGSLFSSQLLKAWDMDITMSSNSTANQSNSRVDIHWNNVGKLNIRSTTTTQQGGKAPRKVEDVVK